MAAAGCSACPTLVFSASSLEPDSCPGRAGSVLPVTSVLEPEFRKGTEPAGPARPGQGEPGSWPVKRPGRRHSVLGGPADYKAHGAWTTELTQSRRGSHTGHFLVLGSSFQLMPSWVMSPRPAKPRRPPPLLLSSPPAGCQAPVLPTHRHFDAVLGSVAMGTSSAGSNQNPHPASEVSENQAAAQRGTSGAELPQPLPLPPASSSGQ